MKLNQLRCIVEIVNQQLNMTAAAENLFISQPAISRQVQLLESKLGIRIFKRNGKHLSAITPEGLRIITMAREILKCEKGIKELALERNDPNAGVLKIAAPNTQARYVLPEVINKFHQKYQKVAIHLHQGSNSDLHKALVEDRVDFAIITEAQELFESEILLPCYKWHRAIVVQKDHALAEFKDDPKELTIEILSKYNLLTYSFGFTGKSSLDLPFEQAGKKPKVILRATDADVIKTYVRAGLGVGIMASNVITDNDTDLIKIDAEHLFGHSIAHIAIKKGSFLREYALDFIQDFVPHLTKNCLAEIMQSSDSSCIAQNFEYESIMEK